MLSQAKKLNNVNIKRKIKNVNMKFISYQDLLWNLLVPSWIICCIASFNDIDNIFLRQSIFSRYKPFEMEFKRFESFLMFSLYQTCTLPLVNIYWRNDHVKAIALPFSKVINSCPQLHLYINHFGFLPYICVWSFWHQKEISGKLWRNW